MIIPLEFAVLDGMYEFYLTPQGEAERQVTAHVWWCAEQAAGFRAKPGCGLLATAGFSTSTMQGRSVRRSLENP